MSSFDNLRNNAPREAETKPVSRVIKDSGERGFVQPYNAQIAVDTEAQVIVAAEVTQQPIERQQLPQMVKPMQSRLEAVPAIITADAGYWDTTSLKDPAMSGIEMLIAPDSKPHIPGKPLPPNAPRSQEAFRMKEVLATDGFFRSIHKFPAPSHPTFHLNP